MKILFLSYYYLPDLSAGSFRSNSLINKFSKIDNLNVDVLTTFPNRYSDFNIKTKKIEINHNCNIIRFKVGGKSNKIYGQIFSFLQYYYQVMKYVKYKKYNLIFSTSSRLMTSYLSARISKKKNIPLYLDIRDIFYDVIEDILPNYIFF